VGRVLYKVPRFDTGLTDMSKGVPSYQSRCMRNTSRAARGFAGFMLHGYGASSRRSPYSGSTVQGLAEISGCPSYETLSTLLSTVLQVSLLIRAS